MSDPSTAIKNLKNSNTWTVEWWFYPPAGLFSSGSESYVLDTRVSNSTPIGFALNFVGISNIKSWKNQKVNY
jgi:hypothetical protein